MTGFWRVIIISCALDIEVYNQLSGHAKQQIHQLRLISWISVHWYVHEGVLHSGGLRSRTSTARYTTVKPWRDTFSDFSSTVPLTQDENKTKKGFSCLSVHYNAVLKLLFITKATLDESQPPRRKPAWSADASKASNLRFVFSAGFVLEWDRM